MRILKILLRKENPVRKIQCEEMCLIFSFISAAIAEISLSKTLNFKSAEEHACSAYFPVNNKNAAFVHNTEW